MIDESSKTIETLQVVKDFPLLNKGLEGFILDPWENPAGVYYSPDDNNPILKIIEVKRWPHTLLRAVDIPKKTDGSLCITYYKDYYGFANELADFLNENDINTELKPYELPDSSNEIE